MKNKSLRSFIITVLLCLTSLSYSAGQNGTKKSSYQHFQGKINEKYTVELDLIRINDSLYGTFSPVHVSGNFHEISGNKDGNPVQLCGKVNAQGIFNLKKYLGDGNYSFSGKIIDRKILKGTWTIEDGKGKYPFELIEMYSGGSIPLNSFYNKGSINLVKKPDSPEASFQFSYLSPGETIDPVVLDSVQKIISSLYTGTSQNKNNPDMILQILKEEYFQNYLSSNETIYNETIGASFTWELLKYMNIVMNTHYLLSFYLEEYSFTGGAHGLQTREYKVIDLKTGKVIRLNDLFRKNYEKILGEILTDKIREIHHISPDKKLTDHGFFVESISPTDNFYITVNGLGFFYNHYEIAPHSEGPDDVFIPFHDIRNLLLKDSVINGL